MGDSDRPEDDHPETVILPAASTPRAMSAPASDEAASQPPETAEPAAEASVGVHGQVEIGDRLNGIYDVKRLIGRGGMGEVYEAANINSDERVAIKVMLPALAADPKVQALFRKEARTLTRLIHPAVAQYRVLAQEPQLNILYIVTEFVDGQALSDVLGRIHPSPDELRGLTRRLAEGLRAAHELGVVHRDMSPDNVLLPNGRLDQAKIIDFGIAKDLDPSKATIVGDSFAGKLGYVAPEQFGDFGREIGPWTDVYSLGLIILALAVGRNVDMGSTLVEAVDKRRAGVDLSPIPESLRPVLEGMLAADPAKRLRSMDEVLAVLDGASPPGAGASGPAPPSEPRRKPSLPVMIGTGTLAALVVVTAGIGADIALQPKGGSKPPAAQASPAAATSSQPASPAASGAGGAVMAALPGLPCTWLDLADPDPSGGSAIKLVGAAGSPAAVHAAVVKATTDSGSHVANVNLDEVALADQPACTALDAFRAIRAPIPPAGARLSTSARRYEISHQPNGALASHAMITLALRDKALDFALLGVEPSGKFSMIVPSRHGFDQERANNSLVTDLGGDVYRLEIDSSGFQGWTGLLLLTGKGPFDPELVAATPAARGADWTKRIGQAAAAGGWKSEMAWYKVVHGAANPGATFAIKRQPIPVAPPLPSPQFHPNAQYRPSAERTPVRSAAAGEAAGLAQTAGPQPAGSQPARPQSAGRAQAGAAPRSAAMNALRSRGDGECPVDLCLSPQAPDNAPAVAVAWGAIVRPSSARPAS